MRHLRVLPTSKDPAVKQSEKVNSLSYAFDSLVDGDKLCYTPTRWRSAALLGTNNHPVTKVLNWKDRIKLGLEAGTNYDRHFYETIRQHENANLSHMDNYYCTGFKPRTIRNGPYWNALGEGYWSPTPSDPVLRDVALAKVRKFANEYDPMTNVIIPIAELRDFRSLVKTLSTRTLKLAFDVEALLKTVPPGSTSRRKHDSILDYASDLWLAYNFGLRPMIADTKAAAEAVAFAIYGTEHNYRISAKAEKSWHSSTLRSNSGHGWLAYYDQVISRKHSLRYRYTYGFSHLVESYVMYDRLSDRLGVTWGNFIPAIWELIPYSWMIDYFGTIGDVLEDTFTAERRVRYGSLSTLYEEEMHLTQKRLLQPGGDASCTTLISGEQLVRHTHYNRAIVTNVPTRSFRFRTMDEIGHNSVRKLLNLLSILHIHNTRDAKRIASLKRL